MPALSNTRLPKTEVQREYGSIHVHQRTSHFGFQMQVHMDDGDDSVIFALTSQHAQSELGQFCVRVDLITGEIWDTANHTGLIGWLNQNLNDLKKAGATLQMRWEIEHHGGALIPRLQIGDEEWLYPAVPFLADTCYVATVANGSHKISKGYVWCQDRLSM